MLLELTDAQKAILLEIHTLECQKQLAIKFGNPDHDQRNMRAFIHDQGGTDMILYLLNFDQLVLEQAEQKKQDLLDGNNGQ